LFSGWACKGISLVGRRGEIVLVLGDEASGKSRLLTALGESILNIPTISRSTQTMRGSIHINGIDVNDWHPIQLQQGVGVLINDIRTLSDFSQLLSGLTLYEILDPIRESTKARGGEQISGSIEKTAIRLASEISSISSSLVPRLSSNTLSTAVTANEQDLNPLLEKSTQLLTSCDWEKIILTRILAQIISSNPKLSLSSDSIDRCIDGTVLLLDDLGLHMNEMQLARLIKNLRKSGATTLMTSHQWSIGRYVDKIYVIRNGMIVERGTHEELLKIGPQKSVYAARWKEMFDGIKWIDQHMIS
jgi:ABC-type multidrug transport system fused ATPase/permease subunit